MSQPIIFSTHICTRINLQQASRLRTNIYIKYTTNSNHEDLIAPTLAPTRPPVIYRLRVHKKGVRK